MLALAIRAGVEVSAERRRKIVMDNALRASSILIGIKHEGGGTSLIAMDKRIFFHNEPQEAKAASIFAKKAP